MSDAPHSGRVVDREAEVYRRFTERAKEHFSRLVTSELIEEHRRSPLGAKSPALLHLLDLMRQAPLRGKLAVFAIEPGRSYQVIRLSGQSGVPNDTTDPARFATEDEALHEVFLRRLAELGLIEHPAPAVAEPSWPSSADAHLIGYTDRLDARPGETLTVHASTDFPVRAAMELVELGYGEPTGEVRERTVRELGIVDVVPQRTLLGSSASVPALGAASALDASGGALVATFQGTSPDGRRQLLLGQRDGNGDGWALVLDGGAVALDRLVGGDARRVVGFEREFTRGAWYAVGVSFGGAEATLSLAPVVSHSAGRTHAADEAQTTATGADAVHLDAGALHVAGWPDAEGREAFDGKIESPFLATGHDVAERVASRARHVPVRDLAEATIVWDPAAALAGGSLAAQRIPAFRRTAAGWTAAPELDAACVNTPTWAVTSSGWDTTVTDFRLRPEQWAAVHFHSDDLDDVGWDATASVLLPEDLPSGAYAVKLTSPGQEPERLPVFVEAIEPKAKVAVIIPTASYIAYANDHPGTQAQMAQATASRTPVLMAGDLFMNDHPELGRSCYDSHADGSGVGYTSLRRPLLNMRPTHRYHVGAWQLPADLHLLSWLNDEGIEYEVVTDHTLHRRGLGALEKYRAVMTTSHSEYYSTEMLDAVEGFIAAGGRFLYLGANGFYWRVAFDPERPWVMELRRGENGSRAWQARPGEQHHALTGERGGLWANLGRASNRIFGVGFSAQGFDNAGWYRRMSDSHDARAAFIFEGVEGETFGHEGTEGGAAGQEIDRYDVELGTPVDTLLLATSEGLSEGYLRTVEEIHFLVAGTSASVDHKVRADMTYFVNADDGAVFSTGSIAWSLSLGLDEGVSRITRNVIDRFADEEGLEW